MSNKYILNPDGTIQKYDEENNTLDPVNNSEPSINHIERILGFRQ